MSLERWITCMTGQDLKSMFWQCVTFAYIYFKPTFYPDIRFPRRVWDGLTSYGEKWIKPGVYSDGSAIDYGSTDLFGDNEFDYQDFPYSKDQHRFNYNFFNLPYIAHASNSCYVRNYNLNTGRLGITDQLDAESDKAFLTKARTPMCLSKTCHILL